MMRAPKGSGKLRMMEHQVSDHPADVAPAKLVFNFRLIHWKSSCTSHAISFKLLNDGEQVSGWVSEWVRALRWKMKNTLKIMMIWCRLLLAACSILSCFFPPQKKKNDSTKRRNEIWKKCVHHDREWVELCLNFLLMQHFSRCLFGRCSNFNATRYARCERLENLELSDVYDLRTFLCCNLRPQLKQRLCWRSFFSAQCEEIWKICRKVFLFFFIF